MENIHLKPSVIILDFNLNPQPPAKMNGLDVLRRIKNANPKIKVVILSGRDEYQGVLDSLKQGAYTYVLKDTEALVSIKKILDVLSNNTFDSQDRGIDTP